MSIHDRLEAYRRGFEPVRARDWALTVVLPLVGVLAAALTDWDAQTGWMGLVAGIIVKLSTGTVRKRTTAVAKLEAKGIDTAPLYGE